MNTQSRTMRPWEQSLFPTNPPLPRRQTHFQRTWKELRANTRPLGLRAHPGHRP